jgi:hypothetical protein
MSDKKTQVDLEFAPGCFDEFEGTQEDLDQLIQAIRHFADSLARGEDPLSQIDGIEFVALDDSLDLDPDQVINYRSSKTLN